MKSQKLQLTPNQAFAKRMFDVLLSSIFLLLLAPLMFALAVAAILDSPGPALFKYRRFGTDGSNVITYKFRTMRMGMENKPIYPQTAKEDSRLSPFGSFLRRTSLDELPQFLNVLMGDLSIVGPRPKHAQEYEHYKSIAEIPIFAKSGITFISRGQSYGANATRGETMKLLYEQEKSYINNWSMWLDLKIVGQTVVRGFFKSNDY